MRTFTPLVLAGLLSVPAAAQPPEPLKLPMPVPDLVKALIDVLKDADAEVRINAGNALAAIGPSAVEALTTALGDPNRDARSAAAYALGTMGSDAAPAVPSLVKSLKDAETDVRRQSAQALGRILLAQRFPSAPVQPPPLPLPPPPVFPSEKP
jgi:HEAT repeat protein